MVDVVASGRTAAHVGIGEFHDVDVGDRLQEGSRFGADALGVGEVACVVVGYAKGIVGARRGDESVTVQEHAEVDDP